MVRNLAIFGVNFSQREAQEIVKKEKYIAPSEECILVDCLACGGKFISELSASVDNNVIKFLDIN